MEVPHGRIRSRFCEIFGGQVEKVGYAVEHALREKSYIHDTCNANMFVALFLVQAHECKLFLVDLRQTRR